MHTPVGTLERDAAPPSSYSTPTILTQPSIDNDVMTHVLSLPNTDNCNNLTNSVRRLQTQLHSLSLHKSSSEPSVVVAVNNAQPEADSSPETPQPAYDINKGWIGGIFTCLRPVFSMIGKGQGNEIKCQDDWEIPFEQISDLQYIGCGGQAIVFSGKYKNQQVAVKKLNAIEETDIKHLRKLNHENIVKFKGVCTQKPCYGIVMEFCQYGPLYDLLKNQKNVVTASRVVSWAKQIASGMYYLHSQKIIHRDLKSPNVLIGDEEVIKISDFGTSRTWNGVSEKMSFAGTVAWMAPEAIQELECSEKVDIWSFGIVLWELLTCQSPYENMEQSAIMYLVGCGKLRPPIPKTCPDGFRLIMEMCWKFSPRERPAFKLILNHLQIASVEILGKYEDAQFFKTQESWKEEIKSQITQFKAQLQKHRIEVQLKEEQLIKKRETEIKHVRDIRELYDRKLEKVNQLYLELAGVLQQVEQYRQGGRKRRLITPFVRKMERKQRCSNASTTPTSPEHSLTSPDSPQNQTPAKAPLYAPLNASMGAATGEQVCKSFRKKHYRSNSGSPRTSCSRASIRSAVVDAGTQTDSMDLSETDASPTNSDFQNTLIKRNAPAPQRVILQEMRPNDDDEAYNGNSVHLYYVDRDKEAVEEVEVFARVRTYNHEDAKNRNHRDYSDEDNLEMVAQKVSALKNGNMFTDGTENGNVNDEIGEVIRKRCANATTCSNGQEDSTEDACNDTGTDEEGDCYNSLRRRSVSRRPIRRFSRSKYGMSNQKEVNASDEGDTSEYSISPSSKSSTLESNPDRIQILLHRESMKRHSEKSDSDSDSEEQNVSIVSQIPFSIKQTENLV